MRRRDVNRLGLALLGLGASGRVAWGREAGLTPGAYFDRLEAFGLSGGGFVIEGGQTVWSRAVGWSDKAAMRRFDARTAFNIASITKTMTALTVLSLAAEGTLSPGDPVSRFLPEAPEAKGAITLGQLMSHTSALPRDVRRPAGSLDKAAMLAPIWDAETASAPGERFNYSNEGYRLLAAVIEAADGRSYREAVRARVFGPAGMTDSGFIQEPPPGRDLAQGYVAWGGLGDFRTTQRLGWNEGAGNVVSTLDDMARFARAIQSGRIIPADWLAQAQSKQSPDAGTTGYLGYGWGWYIGALASGAPLIVHAGDNPGYHDELRWYPQADRWIYVISTRDLYDDSGQSLGLHVGRIGANLSRMRTGVAFEPPPPGQRIDLADGRGLGGDFATSDGAIRLYRVDPADPHLTAIALGQEAANALTGASPEDAARLAAINDKTIGLARNIAKMDTTGLRTQLGDLAFFAAGWVNDMRGWVEAHGAFTGFGPITSRETPLTDQVRTWLPFRFERGEALMEFTWNGEALYESLTETGTPSSVVLPVARLEDGGLVAWDMVTNARVTMQPTSRGLRIGDGTYSRTQSGS